MSEVPLAAVVTQVFIPPVSEAPLAAVQQRERDTMHPHFMTAMLRVDAIPIHRARKYSTGEDHRVGRDDGEGCLIKQLQRQGFVVILADVLAGMVGPLIKTAKLVDPTVAGSDQLHEGCRAGAPPISLRRTVLT